MDRSTRQGPGLVEILDHDIIPRLTPDIVYSDVQFVRRSESGWRGPCPLHPGHDPNFVVNPRTLSWTCYSHCGHGSVTSYLNGGEPARGQDWVAIVERLAALAGVVLPTRRQTPEEMEAAREAERRQGLFGSYLALATRELLGDAGTQAREYLARRGVPTDFDSLTAHDLGLHPRSRRELHGQGHPETFIAELGLSDTRWTGRIVGAWRARNGAIASFFARTISEDGDAKYLYLRGASLPLLYGLPDRWHSRQRTRSVIAVEGVFDAIQLHLHDLPNAGAVGSNVISAERLAGLRATGIEELVLVPDADETGRAGAVRTIQHWRGLTDRFRLVVVADGALQPSKDADEYLRRQGKEALMRVLDEAVPANVYEACLLLRAVQPDSALRVRREGLDRIGRLIRSLDSQSDALDIEDIVRLAASSTGYSLGAVAAQCGVAIPTSPLSDHLEGDRTVPAAWASTAEWHPLLRAVFGPRLPAGTTPVETPAMWARVDEMARRSDPRRGTVLSLRYGRDGPARELDAIRPAIERVGFGSGPVTRERIRQLEAKALQRLRVERYARRLVTWPSSAAMLDWKKGRGWVADTGSPSADGRRPRVGQPWTSDEEAVILDAFERGDSVDEIARRQGRAPGGIRSRLVRLGFLDAQGS